MTDSQPIRGVVRWSEGIDTEIVYSRTLEDGTERHVEDIELDGERYERRQRHHEESFEWLSM